MGWENTDGESDELPGEHGCCSGLRNVDFSERAEVSSSKSTSYLSHFVRLMLFNANPVATNGVIQHHKYGGRRKKVPTSDLGSELGKRGTNRGSPRCPTVWGVAKSWIAHQPTDPGSVKCPKRGSAWANLTT